MGLCKHCGKRPVAVGSRVSRWLNFVNRFARLEEEKSVVLREFLLALFEKMQQAEYMERTSRHHA